MASFGCRHSLHGHPVPPGASAPLAIGLPCRQRRRGPERGFRVPHARDTAGSGAFYTPGAAVPARPVHVPGRRLPLLSGQPLSPWTTTRPRMCISRGISKGSLSFTPASLPLACGPRRNGTLGLFPGLHTRPDMIQPRMPGRGRAKGTARTTFLASASLLRRTHSLRATTRRNMPDTCRISVDGIAASRIFPGQLW